MRDDRDRQEWFKRLDRVGVRRGGRFFAWALMDNHFHLFFQTPQANLSAGMHDLNSGYRRFVEEGLQGQITSPLESVVGRVFLGSAEWVERMRHMLGPSEVDPNVAELKHLAWRPSPERIEWAVAAEFGVQPSQLFVKRLKNHEARVAAIYLIRKLSTIRTMSVAFRSAKAAFFLLLSRSERQQ